MLKRDGISIGMDGRGRALDNIFVEPLWQTIKYEDIYLKDYSDMVSLTVGLTEYFSVYYQERPHQSLDNKTPNRIYKSAQGGGAIIVDRFTRNEETVINATTGQRRPAVEEVERTA